MLLKGDKLMNINPKQKLVERTCPIMRAVIIFNFCPAPQLLLHFTSGSV
jgi:hypothetical protein